MKAISRRSFAKFMAVAPALLSRPLRASGLDNEVDAVLKKEFVIDTAASDHFFRYPDLPATRFDPEAILRIVGGAALGIGALTPQYPKFLPEDSLLRKRDVLASRTGSRPIFDGGATVEHILGELEWTHRTVEEHPDRLGIALRSEDMIALRRQGKLALVLGLDTGNEIDGNLLVLEEYYRLGLRKLALSHEVPPPWAESDTSDAPAGLRPFGREVVGECNRLGIMVDVSHSSDRTFWGAIECTRKPIIATHSGARAVGNMSRNMGDDMIRALAKNGGMIGVGGILDQKAMAGAIADGVYTDRLQIALWLEKKYPNPDDLDAAWRNPARQAEARKTLGLGPGPHITQVYLTNPQSTLAHIDYIVGLTGFDHVGIGTDVEMSDGDYAGMIRGIVAGLIQRRYTEEQLRKILGGNFLRVFGDNGTQA